MKAHLLIVDDEPLIRTSVKRAFEGAGHLVEAAASLADALAAIARRRFDLVVLDLKLGDGDGLDALVRLGAEAPETKVVLITAYSRFENAVTAMKRGAFDLVKKPFELDELFATANNALHASALERRLAYHEGRERDRMDVAGLACPSPAMARVAREVSLLASQAVRVVLVTGERGSGKALIARRLHDESGRSGGPFVELNAAMLPEALVERTLFGDERGAAPMAGECRPGLVEVADGGMLFLDEIEELPPDVQARLLSFLDSYSFCRVGSTTPRTVELCLVVATSRDLLTSVNEGRFREDLYDRLVPFTLDVPPLRERREDIRPLAEHFLVRSARCDRRRPCRLAEDAAALLTGWSWPGNERELESVIERAVLMSDADTLTPEHLPVELVAPVALGDGSDRVLPLAELERRYIRGVLALVGGNMLRAAERLGISRQTLANRLGGAE